MYKVGDKIRITETNSLFMKATGMKGRITEIDDFSEIITVELFNYPLPLYVQPIEIEKIF